MICFRPLPLWDGRASCKLRSHWLLRGHNCFPPKSLSGQRYKIYNIRQLHQRTGSSLLPSNADQRSPLQRDLMNVQLYDKSLKDSPEWSFWKQLILFPSNLNASFSFVSASGDKINFPSARLIKSLLIPKDFLKQQCHNLSYNLRIIQENFQPKIGRKIKYSAWPEKNILIKKSVTQKSWLSTSSNVP